MKEQGDAAVVRDHVVHLFYLSDIDDDNAAVVLADLASIRPTDAWLPNECREVILGRYSAEPLWRLCRDTTLSRDLLSPVRELLSGGDESRLQRYIWAESAGQKLRRVLSGRPLNASASHDRKLSLTLKLSKRARERLARTFADVVPDFLLVNVEPPTMLRFRSGVGLLDLPVTFRLPDDEPLELHFLVEAVKAVGRRNLLCWRTIDGEAVGQEFSIGCIARGMLEGRDASCGRNRRTVTSTYVQLDQSVDDDSLENGAVMLARHLTDDYRCVERSVSGLEGPFADVKRAVAPEGSCIAVRCRPEIEFLREYKNASFHRAYLPLIQLALHEEAALLKLMAKAACWPDLARAPRREVKTLEGVRTRSMQLKLAYNFARVSLLSHHDAWHQAVEIQLRLPALRDGLDADILAIQDAAREAHRRNRAWLEGLGGGFIAVATTFSILKDVMLPSYPKFVNGQVVAGTVDVGHGIVLATAPSVAAVASAFVGILVGVLLFQRERD